MPTIEDYQEYAERSGTSSSSDDGEDSTGGTGGGDRTSPFGVGPGSTGSETVDEVLDGDLQGGEGGETSPGGGDDDGGGSAGGAGRGDLTSPFGIGPGSTGSETVDEVLDGDLQGGEGGETSPGGGGDGGPATGGPERGGALGGAASGGAGSGGPGRRTGVRHETGTDRTGPAVRDVRYGGPGGLDEDRPGDDVRIVTDPGEVPTPPEDQTVRTAGGGIGRRIPQGVEIDNDPTTEEYVRIGDRRRDVTDVAQELEQQVLEEMPPEIGREDVKITTRREDGQVEFSAEFTDPGREDVVRLGVAEALGVSSGATTATVTSAGAGGGDAFGSTPAVVVGPTGEGQEEFTAAVEQSMAEQIVQQRFPAAESTEIERVGPNQFRARVETQEGGEESQLLSFDPVGPEGRPVLNPRLSTSPNLDELRQSVERRLEARAAERAGRPVDLERGEDFYVDIGWNQEGRRTARPAFTAEGYERYQEAVDADEFEREVREIPGELYVPIVGPALAAAEIAGVPGSDVVPDARFEDLPGQEEDATLEDVTRGTSEAYTRASEEFVERAILGSLPGDRGFERPTARRIYQGFQGGAALPAVIPDLVTAVEEGREFGLEAVDVGREEGTGIQTRRVPTTPGTGPSVRTELADEGAAPFVVEESREFGRRYVAGLREQLSTPGGQGRLIGSTVAATATMGAAGAVSGRLGAAARWAIQPGEEIATAGATRVAPGLAARFPGGRVDWEEPIVYGAGRAASRTYRAGRRAAALARGTEPLGPSPRQARYIGRFRPTRPRTPESALGGAGSGPLLTAEAVDEAMGVSDPATLAEARAAGGGPFQVAFGRTAAEVRAEQLEQETEPEFDPSPDYLLEGGTIESAREEMVERQKEARRMLGGDYEDVAAPIEAETERVEAARRPGYDTEARRGEAERFATELVERPDVRGDATPEELTVQAERPALAEGLDVAAASEADQEAAAESALDVLQEADVESILEFEAAFEFESEGETEPEQEQEFETEVELEGGRPPKEGRRSVPGFGIGGGASPAADALGAGWINVYQTALAGGGLEARQTPENVEAIAAERGEFLPLPTRGQVDPDEELAERLEAVQAFFPGLGGDGGRGGESGAGFVGGGDANPGGFGLEYLSDEDGDAGGLLDLEVSL